MAGPKSSTPIQGSQFISHAFTGALADAGIRISMDGPGRIGRWIDFYNQRGPHSALGDRTPDEAYAIEIQQENLAETSQTHLSKAANLSQGPAPAPASVQKSCLKLLPGEPSIGRSARSVCSLLVMLYGIASHRRVLMATFFRFAAFRQRRAAVVWAQTKDLSFFNCFLRYRAIPAR
jgi:hypothetical protein